MRVGNDIVDLAASRGFHVRFPRRVLTHREYARFVIGGFSERVLWKVVDAGIIDGAVNGAGTFVSGASSILRRLQTGSVRAYAVSLVFGVVAVLGYYLWRFVALVAQRGV